jgi:hypothetical protein
MANNFTNDKYMTYDIEKHQYILTPQALLDLKGVDLSAIFNEDQDVQTQAFLLRVSQAVYGYALGLAQDPMLTQYMLSLPSFRTDLRDALAEQAFDIALNRTDPGAFFSGQGINELVTPIVRSMMLNSGIAFRGTYARNSYPADWMDSKGTAW